jgi:hypothetical protein
VKRALPLLLATVSACSSPPPRDIAFFEKHAAEAERVARSCEAGERSNECANAQAGLARLRTKARLERYRKGFQ